MDLRRTFDGIGSKFHSGSDTKLMQDNNGKNRINGKRDRNKQNKP
jgi:hypothetical protein